MQGKQGADLAALGFSKLFHSAVTAHCDDLQVRQACCWHLLAMWHLSRVSQRQAVAAELCSAGLALDTHPVSKVASVIIR